MAMPMQARTVGAGGGQFVILSHTLLRGLARALACNLVVAGAALAQSTIVVSGSRVPLVADRVAADVVVIDAERIAASSADSLEDLLRREAGLQLARSGGPGASASVLIRGANGGHTLVLVDGVRIGAASAGLTEFEGLSLAHIERVEVLRGPASSLYGADAVGGVVQIFTRRSDVGWQAQGTLGGGGSGARNAAGSVSWGDGAFDAALTLADERLRGVSALRPGDLFGNFNPDADGFARQSASARLGMQLSPLQRLQAQASKSHVNSRYDGSEFLPPTYAQNSAGDFRNVLSLWSGSVEHQARWSPDWRSELRLARQSSDSSAGAAAPDRFRTDREQRNAQLSWTPNAQQQLTLALDHLQEQVRSTSYLAPAQRSNRGVALAWAGSFDAWSVQADGRRDENSQFGGVTTGRVGASLKLAPGWRVRAVAGSSFRAVSFNDLYYPGYGVATLKPESGRSVELGVDWRGTQLPNSTFNATLYRNDVSELVAYEPDRRLCPADPSYNFGCARNIGRARLQGATLQGVWRSGPWTARGTLDFLDAKDRDSGARLTRRAAHQERYALEWAQGAVALGAEVLSIGARPEGGKTLAAATLVDLSARYKPAQRWTLQLQLRNATNRDHEPARDYQSLPRQWWLALRWEQG